MSRPYNQYSVIAGPCAPNNDKYIEPRVAITGFSDMASAVDAMNKWLNETAAAENAKLAPDQADGKLFTEHGALDTDPEIMPSNGYIYGFDKGTRENYTLCTVICSVTQEPNANLPEMPTD